MAKQNTKSMRIMPNTEETLRRISAIRFSNGIDKVQLPPWRIIDAAFNIPNVLPLLKTRPIKYE